MIFMIFLKNFHISLHQGVFLWEINLDGPGDRKEGPEMAKNEKRQKFGWETQH